MFDVINISIKEFKYSTYPVLVLVQGPVQGLGALVSFLRRQQGLVQAQAVQVQEEQALVVQGQGLRPSYRPQPLQQLKFQMSKDKIA
jgi:hypothetical protein